MKILFKLATRSRPDKATAAINTLIEHISDRDNYQIIVSVDNDDMTMANWSHPCERLVVCHGTSLNKVHAYNRDIERCADWDILISTSDDMRFFIPGFDNEIRQDFAGNYDQLLHYPDGNQKLLITLPIMGRQYYKRFGYVYHPAYTSLWCDNEQQDVAMMLGKYRRLDKQLFQHEHPAYGHGTLDELYRRNEALYHSDNAIYKRRKYELNFDIPQMAPLLSILIPSVPQREEMLFELCDHINGQIGYGSRDKVQVLFDQRMGITTGTKRNDLLDRATGEYVWFIDDDDWISDTAISDILDVLATSRPDVIAINGWMTTDGADQKGWDIRLGNPFQAVQREGKEFYLRSPNHITPMRREHALKARFPDKSNFEDKAFADELLRLGCLKTQSFILNPIYHYRYSTKNKLY